MRWAILAVLLWLLTACGSSTNGPAPTPDPAGNLRSLQLRSGDVATGFYLAGVSALTPDQAARTQGVNPARYRAAGGGASLAERFVLRHPATIGLTFIASQRFAFDSAGHASAGFRLLRVALAHSGTIGTVQWSTSLGTTPRCR